MQKSDATRANLTIVANYVLKSRVSGADNKVVFSGSVKTTSGYNIFTSEFQTLSAEKSARERALKDVAQQLRIRLATAKRQHAIAAQKEAAMKISAGRADTFLQKPDKSVRAILLFGPDAGLVRERAKILPNAKRATTDAFAMTEIDWRCPEERWCHPL